MMIALVILLSGMLLSPIPATGDILQDSGLVVFDQVEVPREWTGQTGWHISSRESWAVYPGRPSIRKNTENWQPTSDALPDLSPDSVKRAFMALLGQNLRSKDARFRGEISYEFVLLEPHAAGAGTGGFTSPDSMDAETRWLQRALVTLVERHGHAQKRFDLETGLLSVRFRESWEIDPATGVITRQVRSVTPVIWQRRRIAGGEAIDEPETGYPVYYKNQLQPILLRNP